VSTQEYPFVLITGRTLQQFNAGTMTHRGGHKSLRSTDYLDISPVDAKDLEIKDKDRIGLYSRYGHIVMPVHITDSVLPGQLFATFHDSKSALNYITGPFRDPRTATPEYKLTAVRLEKLSSDVPQRL
jgi:formate dehydrogenase major subunit